MKSKGTRLGAAAIVLQLTIGIAVAGTYDDDLMELQQEQFRLERQLRQQEWRFQQQQLRLDRQLADQQRRMQQQFTLDQQPWEQYRRWPPGSPTSLLRDYQTATVRTDWLSQRSMTTPLPLSLAGMMPSPPAYSASALSSGFVPVWFNGPAVGMTPEAATYALSGMRGGGGHAMRHWIEGRLIPDKYSLAMRRESFFRPNAQAILEDPLMTFEAQLGSTRTTGYLGRGVGGRWDGYQPVFVAGEGPYKGRVISAYSDLRLDQQVKYGISKWQSLDGLSMRTASQLRAVQGGLMVLDVALTAAQTFVQTMDYVGRSMQIMNPPTYLQENPSFTPTQTVLGMPITGTREGFGSYSIPGLRGGYYEMLSTGGPEPITRVHTEWATNGFGSYYRSEQVTTPSVSGFERFMMTHYPLGSYWDETSTVSYTQTSSAAWRETYSNGVLTVTPLDAFDAGSNLSTLNHTFGYSSGLNSRISQPTFNNSFASYGNNYQMYQPTFDNTFGGYNNRMMYPDFKSINNTQPRIDDAFRGYPGH